jgi:hypothetical protein
MQVAQNAERVPCDLRGNCHDRHIVRLCTCLWVEVGNNHHYRTHLRLLRYVASLTPQSKTICMSPREHGHS